MTFLPGFTILLAILTLAWSYQLNNITDVENLLVPRNVLGAVHNQHPTSSSSSRCGVRIIAIGDLHGDYRSAMNILKFSGVVDKKGKWSGNVDVLVQMGDLFDRGIEAEKLVNLMHRLYVTAPEKGGKVFLLMGNHEYYNAEGYWKYVSEDEIKRYGTELQRWDLFRSGGWIAKLWAEEYNIAVRIPLTAIGTPENTAYDSRAQTPPSGAVISFIHAGIGPGYKKYVSPFPTLFNNIGKSLLATIQKKKNLVPNNKGVSERVWDTASEKWLHGENGPLHYRAWNRMDEPELCQKLKEVLEDIGSRRIVVGHEVHSEITTRCGGKLIYIDTKISSVYGKSSVLSALSITYEGVRSNDGVCRGRETIRALYEGSVKTLVGEEQPT